MHTYRYPKLSTVCQHLWQVRFSTKHPWARMLGIALQEQLSTATQHFISLLPCLQLGSTPQPRLQPAVTSAMLLRQGCLCKGSSAPSCASCITLCMPGHVLSSPPQSCPCCPLREPVGHIWAVICLLPEWQEASQHCWGHFLVLLSIFVQCFTSASHTTCHSNSAVRQNYLLHCATLDI